MPSLREVKVEDGEEQALRERLLEQGFGTSEGEAQSADSASPDVRITRTVSRFSQRRSPSQLLSRKGSDSCSEPDLPGSSIAFRIQVGTDADPDASVNIDVHHDAVHEAVQNAMDQAVHGAVQRVMENPDNFRFDVKANLYTFMAITGVILYWRGVWTTWDWLFGFSIYSELGAVLVGLAIMLAFRIAHVPLLDGLPSG